MLTRRKLYIFIGLHTYKVRNCEFPHWVCMCVHWKLMAEKTHSSYWKKKEKRKRSFLQGKAFLSFVGLCFFVHMESYWTLNMQHGKVDATKMVWHGPWRWPSRSRKENRCICGGGSGGVLFFSFCNAHIHFIGSYRIFLYFLSSSSSQTRKHKIHLMRMDVMQKATRKWKWITWRKIRRKNEAQVYRRQRLLSIFNRISDLLDGKCIKPYSISDWIHFNEIVLGAFTLCDQNVT